LAVTDVPTTGRSEDVVNGIAVETSEVVEFAAGVLDPPIVLVLLELSKVVVDSADSAGILAVLSVVVLAIDVAGAVMTATGEGVTKVKIPVVEIQLAESGLQAYVVVVRSDEELVDDPESTTSVADGLMGDVIGVASRVTVALIGVASRLTVPLTPIETSCLRRRGFGSIWGT